MSANETVLPGERLRRAREEKGLSQEEACKHLRLSSSYMRALEQDDYERLPEAPFIKGYLRNYARFLGLPAEELARQFQQRVDEMRQDEREREQAALDETPSSREWRLPALAVLVVVLLVAVGWWLWPRDQLSAPDPTVDDGGRGGEETFGSPAAPEAPRPAMPETTEPVEPADDSLQPLPENDGGNDQGSESPSNQSNDGSSGGQPASRPELAEQASQPQAARTELAAAPGEDGIDSLTLEFSRVCWIKVVDATGATLAQGQQNAGGSVDLDGEAPFRVTVGDAAAVSAVRLNGSAVSLPSQRSGDVVRVTLP
ncbi:MAG TPA: RodZ domain-containing protein [Alcanivorax sp.]|nr:RodZ domain-containing protein [Alcanivorax sp.]